MKVWICSGTEVRKSCLSRKNLNTEKCAYSAVGGVNTAEKEASEVWPAGPLCPPSPAPPSMKTYADHSNASLNASNLKEQNFAVWTRTRRRARTNRCNRRRYNHKRPVQIFVRLSKAERVEETSTAEELGLANATHLDTGCFEDFRRPVLGCIDASDSESMLIFHNHQRSIQ